jgi:RalA-binding protein 1
MTMRNVGIVFSPTLGIPAGVFSLMLGEFTRVFSVDDGEVPAAEEADEPETEDGEATPQLAHQGGLDRRNSRRYTDAAADRLLGLAGRTLAGTSHQICLRCRLLISVFALTAPPEDDDSEVEISVQYDDSGAETNETGDATSVESHTDAQTRSKAAATAASRGLSVMTAGGPKRQSRTPIGLPSSPRPGHHQPAVSPVSPAP